MRVLRILVLCAVLSSFCYPVLAAPPDPECPPPSAVTLQDVEGESGKWWVPPLIVSVVAVMWAVIGYCCGMDDGYARGRRDGWDQCRELYR